MRTAFDKKKKGRKLIQLISHGSEYLGQIDHSESGCLTGSGSGRKLLDLEEKNA
jgi:hypothetical protein